MQDEAQSRSRQGTVTVLALLLSLLLGYAPAAASSAEFDRSAARLGKSEVGKAGAVLRTGGRLQSDDEADREDLLAGSAPRVVTTTTWLHPAERVSARSCSDVLAPTSRAYRARAPPAA